RPATATYVAHASSDVDGVAAFQRGESLDGFARLLLCEAKFVKALQIEPELGTGAEEMAQAQRRVSRNGALSVQNTGDPVGRHVELAPIQEPLPQSAAVVEHGPPDGYRTRQRAATGSWGRR